MANITATIITLNEEHNIEACIRSAQQICDEVVVVDSQSSDATREIAQSLGAKVYLQPYLGDGFQKNHCLQYATNDWVFSLDADERISPALAEEIERVELGRGGVEAYMLRRKSFIGNRWIKYCGWYPDRLSRLFNRHKTRFSAVMGHASVETKRRAELRGEIIHYAYPDFHAYEQQLNRFSTRGARMMFDAGKKVSPLAPFGHGLFTFLKAYLLKRGFLGGTDGLTVSTMMAHYAFMKYAKLLEMQRDPKALERSAK